MAGLDATEKDSVVEVAEATITCLLESVPAAVGAIAFLSGGQSAEMASAHLNAMQVRFRQMLPWPLTFSFARAIQQPAMEIWQGKDENIVAAQQALNHRAACDKAARSGKYTQEMERTMI